AVECGYGRRRVAGRERRGLVEDARACDLAARAHELERDLDVRRRLGLQRDRELPDLGLELVARLQRIERPRDGGEAARALEALDGLGLHDRGDVVSELRLL